jgi:predicted esterase
MMRILTVGIALACLLGGAVFAADGPAALPYEIPRLDNIGIDGNPAEWGNRGFRVDVMADTASTRPWGFESSFRLGWDDRGLLALVSVTEPTSIDGPDHKLASGDSVELMLADGADPDQGVQVIVAPGPDLGRQQINDRRDSASTRRYAASVTTACTRRSDGYTAEILVPWQNIGLTPGLGRQAYVQVCVNNYASPGKRYQAVWWPQQDRGNPADAYPVLLSDRASPAIHAAAFADYERFRRARVYVTASGPQDQSCTIGAPQLPPVSVQFEPHGQHLAAQAWLPMPPPGQTYPFIAVRVGGTMLPVLHLPDPQVARHDAFLHEDVLFNPPVFTDAAFPDCDFEHPAEVEDLIGPYVVQPTFYDSHYNVVTSAQTPGRYGAIVHIQADDGKTYTRFATVFREPDDVDWADTVQGFAATLPNQLVSDAGIRDEYSDAINDFAHEAFVSNLRRESIGAQFLAWVYEARPGAPDQPDFRTADQKWWFGLRQKLGLVERPRYLVNTPPAYNRDKSRKWPLIVFLHGSGERGDNLDVLKTQGLTKLLQTKKDLPFVVVSPQVLPLERWNPWEVNMLIDEVRQKYRIDDDRIYLTGLSMGGFGTWETAWQFPQRFAAVAPICGSFAADEVAKLKDLPIWVFHGVKDPVVPISGDRKCVETLQKIGGHVRYTFYPEGGHDVWTETYADPRLYSWLLQQRRGHSSTEPSAN